MVTKKDNDLLNQKLLVEAIISKKELNSVDEFFVVHELSAFLIRDIAANKYVISGEINSRNKEFKRIVKSVRFQIRRAHSLFEVGDRSRDYLRYTSELKEVDTFLKLKKVAKEILNSHKSSSERIEEYELFYAFLIKKVKRINSIMDLGAGLHPLSIVYLAKKYLFGLDYLALDINNSEQDLLNLFFIKLSAFCSGFNGESKLSNLLDSKKLKKLSLMKKVDLALMLKLTDHLDRGKGHKKTEEVIRTIPARFVLISFATVTSSGKRMRYPKRRWVEYLCQRLEYSFEIFETRNELFYLIEK